MTFAVTAWRNVHIAYPCLLLFKSVFRNVLAGSFFLCLCVRMDSAAVSPPGTAPTVNMIQAEDRLLMLMISVTGVDFRALF